MPGAVCKVIICGSPWLAIVETCDVLQDDSELSDIAKKSIRAVGKSASQNHTVVQNIVEHLSSINAEVPDEDIDALELWAEQGARQARKLLVMLTQRGS